MRSRSPTTNLVIGKATAEDRDKLPTLKEIAPGFADRAPLWAYILSEAQVTSWDRAPVHTRIPRIASPSSSGPSEAGSSPTCSPPCFAATPRPTSHQGAPFTPIPEFTRDGKFGLAELINVALRRTP